MDYRKPTRKTYSRKRFIRLLETYRDASRAEVSRPDTDKFSDPYKADVLAEYDRLYNRVQELEKGGKE